MSRIDEALRRAGASGAPAQGAAAPGEQVFVSAWESDAHAAVHEIHAAPPPRSAGLARRGGDSERVTGFSHEQVVTLNRGSRERLAVADGDPTLVEQFRRLAATLHHAQATSNIRVIMMTSASPNDGKTLTAVNLALVLSESYRKRVLLIDADLRRPSLGNIADITDAPGLNDTLRAKSDQKVALLQVTPTLMLLPAGRPDTDPMRALTSMRMRHILEEAAERFDWVILDAPPMCPLADGTLLSQMVDGAVFVIRAGQTQFPEVQRAVDALGRERILGVVLNGLDHMPSDPYVVPQTAVAEITA